MMQRYRLGLLMVTLALFTVCIVLTGCRSKEGKEENTITFTENGNRKVSNDGKPEDSKNIEGKDSSSVSSSENSELAIQMHFGSLQVENKIVYQEDFEDGSSDFVGRGAAEAAISSQNAYGGKRSICSSGRTAYWNGVAVDLTDNLTVQESYHISASVMYDQGPDSMEFHCKIEKNSSEYLSFGSVTVKKGEWTKLTGQILIPADTRTASVYFETSSMEEEDFISFYVDDIVISQETVTAERGEIPILKELYKDNFSIGVAATLTEISSERQELIKEQLNSFTIGNELKPDSLLDYARCISDKKYNENPAVNFKYAKPLLEFAEDAGIPMRGHTLVWHNQTPRWFFAEGYSMDQNAPFVTKELMLKRMENYIKNVLEYVQDNYPGLVYAWDVVNEAIDTGDGQPGFLRSEDSYWYQVIGPEYVEKAFEYARKYADSDVRLFYNDYNTEERSKMLAIYDLISQLKEKQLIDGIGLQNHIRLDSPSLTDIQESIRKYAELGLEIHITELDMYQTDASEEALMEQAQRYKRLFTILKQLDETEQANITNVTFWGLSDDKSWLNKPGVPTYPLLFDKYLIQKPAFWGAALNEDIPLY